MRFGSSKRELYYVDPPGGGGGGGEVFNTKNLFSFSVLKHVFLDLLLENREQNMKPNMC